MGRSRHVIALVLLAAASDALGQPPGAGELAAALGRLAGAHAGRVRVTSLGASRGGRDIPLIEMGRDAGEGPTLLIVAGLHGDRTAGTEIAIRVAEGLLADPALAERLRGAGVLIVPRLDPDGAAAAAGPPRRAAAGNARPVDDDGDGLLDEDPPDDLDGDGLITFMRVPDPAGTHVLHEDDPRVLRPANRARGEAGRFRVLVEGNDDDGDGAWNEDGPGGVAIDRNFPHAFAEHDRGAGPWAVSEPETRALVDLLFARSDVAAVLVYGAADNLTAEIEIGGKGGKEAEPAGRGSRTPHPGDLHVYARAARRYREITGRRGRGAAAAGGSLQLFAGQQLGIPAFITDIFAPPEDSGTAPGGESRSASRPSGKDRGEDEPEVKSDLRWLALSDRNGLDLFVPWRAFSHPVLGDVEIGGFRPGARENPPPSQIQAIAAAEATFAGWLLSALPAPRIASATAVARGPGIFGIEVCLRNDGELPVALAMGRKTGRVREMRAEIAVEPARILQGTRRVRVATLLGGGGSETLRWLIAGESGGTVEISVWTPKNGTLRERVTLP